MVNQLDQFMPDLTHAKSVLHDLTKKGVAWQWLDVHQESFDKVKEMLSKELINHHYDDSLPLQLLTDASRLKGLGYALVQKDHKGQIRVISCGSRSLTSAERNYAVCELECLAIEWAINKKCWWWLKGCPGFTVVTDHNPLKGIFAKPIDQVENSRLQRFRLKLQGYNFQVEWVEGKNHLIADALSRAPLFAPPEEESETEALKCRTLRSVAIEASCRADHACVATCKTESTGSVGIGIDLNLLDMIEKAKEDEDYQKIVKAFRKGTDPKNLCQSHPARALKSVWHDVSLFDDYPLLVVQGHKIVVPKACRGDILNMLHQPHAGQAKTKQNARQLYYWPSMSKDIERVTETCDKCREYLRSQPNEKLQQTVAEYPWQMMSADLFTVLNQKFMVLADRYSGMLFVDKLGSETTAAVTRKLDERFDNMGIRPQSMRADGGPCFKSKEFKDWCSSRKIALEPSSPEHPRSNGHAESAVKLAKTLMLKCGKYTPDYHRRLSEMMNMPRQDGYSPAEMVYGFRQRSDLPALPVAYERIDMTDAELSRQAVRDSVKDNHDKRTVSLPLASVGDKVVVQDPRSKLWNKFGSVEGIYRNGRTYLVKMENGNSYYRNRKFVRIMKDD